MIHMRPTRKVVGLFFMLLLYILYILYVRARTCAREAKFGRMYVISARFRVWVVQVPIATIIVRQRAFLKKIEKFLIFFAILSDFSNFDDIYYKRKNNVKYSIF